MSSIYNPLLYTLTNRECRTYFKKFFKKKWSFVIKNSFVCLLLMFFLNWFSILLNVNIK
jgi:hypothetical protein